MVEDETRKQDDTVKADTVYREMYTEMRRYRDYELNIAKWYCTFSLGYLGAIFLLLHSEGGKPLRDNLEIGCFGKLLLVGVGATICIIGAYSAWYATDRYDHLRKCVSEELEPGWSKKMKPPKRAVEPGYLIWFVPFALFVATCWVVFPDQHPIAWTLTVLTIFGFNVWLRKIIRTGS